jgi:extradiol dioxygenase family protein
MSIARAIALHVSVPVLDLAEAERFYSEAFGARKLSRAHRLTTMDVAGQRLALRQVGEDSSSLQPNGRDGLRARHFGFGVATPAEVDVASERLPALGATVVVGPSDRADGRSAVFCDRSGNQLEVYYREANDG